MIYYAYVYIYIYRVYGRWYVVHGILEVAKLGVLVQNPEIVGLLVYRQPGNGAPIYRNSHFTRAPKGHINIRIPRTMFFAIPLVLGLRTSR